MSMKISKAEMKNGLIDGAGAITGYYIGHKYENGMASVPASWERAGIGIVLFVVGSMVDHDGLAGFLTSMGVGMVASAVI